MEVKVAKTGCLWKFGFCRDLSLDLGVLGLSKGILLQADAHVQTNKNFFARAPFKSEMRRTTLISVSHAWMMLILSGGFGSGCAPHNNCILLSWKIAVSPDAWC
jgi:hypothetical protein